MPRYRRFRAPGATYFFTVVVNRDGPLDLTARIDALRDAWAATSAEHPFRTEALVVLPDHLHAVLTLPPGDSDFPLRWKKLKARVTKRVGLTGPRSPSKCAKGEAGLWQRRYWEHLIRDRDDFERHVKYCWANPVRHGFVRRAADWPHSTFHRDVARGIVAEEWFAEVPDGLYGE